MKVTEAPSGIEQRSLSAHFFSNFMPKAFIPKVIKNLYATPPSLFVPSAPPWHCVYLRPLRDSVCLLYKTFSLSLHISEEPQFIPMLFVFVNYFRTVQKQYMLFWLLKDAQLACKRCPLSPLLTPFWRPIKHLFSCYFITNWFPYGYKPAFCICYFRYL